MSFRVSRSKMLWICHYETANILRAVNIVVVVGSPKIHTQLSSRFATEKTSLGEAIQVVSIDKSDGVVERDESFLEQSREAVIKEYFFGDAKRTLSPQIQQVDFDSLVIYKLADCKSNRFSLIIRYAGH